MGYFNAIDVALLNTHVTTGNHFCNLSSRHVLTFPPKGISDSVYEVDKSLL